jgi:hypothetical protein
MWCHQRESNLRLSITNTLLYHLTMAAFVVGRKGLEPSRLATPVPKTGVSANSTIAPCEDVRALPLRLGPCTYPLVEGGPPKKLQILLGYKPGTSSFTIHHDTVMAPMISNPDIYILPVSNTITVNIVANTTSSIAIVCLPGCLRISGPLSPVPIPGIVCSSYPYHRYEAHQHDARECHQQFV